MAMSMGMMGAMGSGSSPLGSWMGRSGGLLKGRRSARRRSGAEFRCVAVAVAGGLTDQYRTLRLQPGASEKEVKKAFRQLALQFHPDVCKGNNCGVQFHQINEAYDVVMSNLRRSEDDQQQWQAPEWSRDADDYDEESFRGMGDPDWDLWEEWMGWEGAGIRDYSSHINPDI